MSAEGGLRTERYTYIRSINGPWLLYDNHEDPYQLHNLMNAAGARGVWTTLDGQLDRELRVRRDDFLPAHEYLARAGLTHYKEAHVPVGHAVSPWGDWESTLK